MIVSTVLGKIISIFIIMVVGVICYKVGIIDNNTKEKTFKIEHPDRKSHIDLYVFPDGI